MLGRNKIFGALFLLLLQPTAGMAHQARVDHEGVETHIECESHVVGRDSLRAVNFSGRGVAQASYFSEKRARDLLDVLNSRDLAAIRSFIEACFTERALNGRTLDDVAGEAVAVASMIRDAEVLRWEPESKLKGQLIFHNALIDRQQALAIVIQDRSPYSIDRWTRPKDLSHAVEAPASGQEVAQRLDSFVKRLAHFGYFSGTYALTLDGNVVRSGAYGLAERNFMAPNQLETRFQTASMTKMFTAIAIGQLVEQGKLSLEDPLSKFVPDVPTGDRILLKHLLSHTSGLPDLFNGTDFFSRNPRNFRTIADFLAIADKSPPKLQPGKSWQYSNLGYLYLGRAIEIASGEDYDSYIWSHVFQPAGMTHSGFWAFDRPVSNLAQLYEPDGDSYRNALGVTGMVPMPFGGAVSSVPDLIKFSEALNKGIIIKRSTLDDFVNSRPELGSPFYGYGFFFKEYAGFRIKQWGHGGNAMGGCNQFTVLQSNRHKWVFTTLSNGGIDNCRLVYDEASRLIVQYLSEH